MATKIRQLLNEKYRPTSVDDYIFQDENVERKVKKWIKNKEIPNCLFAGTQGSGKSSLAKVLISELGIDPSDVQIVNGSSEGIGYIREVIEPWLKKASFSHMKIVLIEEADALSAKSQQMLRMITEDNTDHVRWIMTCNYPQKIIAPLHSRFEAGFIQLDSMNYEGVLDLVVRVIEEENITFADESDVMSHIDAHQPDIRKILNSIDGHLDENNHLHRLTSSQKGSDEDMWLQLWDSGEVSLEKALGLSELIDQNNFEWFYEVMYSNSSAFPDEGKGIVLLSKYLDRAMVSANQRLHLDAFLYHLFEVDE